jgi:hypothetical protein
MVNDFPEPPPKSNQFFADYALSPFATDPKRRETAAFEPAEKAPAAGVPV